MSVTGPRPETRNVPDLAWLPSPNRRLVAAAHRIATGRPIQGLHQLIRVANASAGLRSYCTHLARQALLEIRESAIAPPLLRSPQPPHQTPEALLSWVVAHPARLVELTEASPAALRLGLLYQQIWDATVWLSLSPDAHEACQEEALHCLDGLRVELAGHPPTPLNPRQPPQARLERTIRLRLGLEQLLAWHPWPWLPRLVDATAPANAAAGPMASRDLPRHWLEARRITHGHLLEERRRINWEQERRRNRQAGLVSVVIPVWGAGRELAACLESLRHMEGRDRLEILLVDNGNTDATTCAVLAEAPRQDPRVQVLRQSRNFGFALGSNLGFAASRGQWVLFLNSDARLEGDALSPLLQALKDRRCRAVQPALLTPTGDVQCLGIVFGSASPLGIALHAGSAPDAALLRPRRVPAVTAACVLLRADEFAAVEGFDVGYLNGQEDTDLCLRLQERFGGTCLVVGQATAIHPEGSSPGRYRFIEANRSRLIARWPHPPQGWLERTARQDGLALVGFLNQDRPGRPAWLRSPRPVFRPHGCGTAGAGER
ncbi:glycosyl transferase, group 2 family protein [Cyanobium sp. PCC 7001]|uniref:glycosyltransferase family 2 protein n=1 Tax=Cyanobium sp. PCC 7001 TaxID=180281 RepID=UPI000180599D|nr:glycosyltransferase family 2 protein [Cyanobium sp. PCC 7001]EDY37618.1 glycosyl transferase, group 2 family protein [Cyanobium sp. PCC 7001]